MDTVFLYFLALGGILAGFVALLWLVRLDQRLKAVEQARVK